MRSALIIVTVCSLAIAACQTPTDQQTSGPQPVSLGPDQSNGEYLAEALCSGCHAVAAGEISANPEAPSFVSIANRDEVTQETLGNFLHDSYSFPNQMNLELSDKDADEISAYILTLRDTTAGGANTR